MCAQSSRSEDGRDSVYSPANRRAIGMLVFTLAVAAVFLIGCFVIGPWLSRIESARTAAEQSTRQRDGTAPPPTEPAASPEPRARVTITERNPAEPTVTKPAAPSIPQESKPSTDTDSETISSPAPEPSAPIAREPEQRPAEPSPVEPLYHVRAGLFSDRSHADALAARLAAAGFTPAVGQVEVSGRAMFAVQAGAFGSRDNADATAAALRRAGFEAVITPGE